MNLLSTGKCGDSHYQHRTEVINDRGLGYADMTIGAVEKYPTDSNEKSSTYGCGESAGSYGKRFNKA